MATFWDKLRSGWGVVWCVQVEGLPIVWAETALQGVVAPTGYTIEPDLVIDRSAEVGTLADRESGIGAGLPLTFRLRDTTAARTWCRAPDVTTFLPAALAAATATPITVDTTSGFDASGTFWVGHEAVTYTGKNATQFTGCTRGAFGSRRMAHRSGTVASLVTNRPRHWRGRLVTLSAVLVTPDGEVDAPGDFTDLAKIVWRGFVDRGPRRKEGQFEVEALALDRLLSRPLAESITGKVLGVDTRFPIDPAFQFNIRLVFRNNVGANLYDYSIIGAPFDGLAAGTLLTTSQAHEAIQAEWAAVLPQTLDAIGGMLTADSIVEDQLVIYKVTKAWKPDIKSYGAGEITDTWAPLNVGAWNTWIRCKADANVHSIAVSTTVGGVVLLPPGQPGGQWVQSYYAGLPAGAILAPQWVHGGNVCKPQAGAMPVQAYGCMVVLDNPVLLPAQTGHLLGDFGAAKYTSWTDVGDATYFQLAAASATLMGKRIEIVTGASGTYADLMRKVLASGDTNGASTYDTLGAGNGYAVPGLGDRWESFTDEASFAQLVTGPLVQLQAAIRSGGKSFADLFGGALALAQRNVVLREEGAATGDACRLGLVSTEPGGSGWTATIGDASLLSLEADPVDVVEVRDVPSVVRIQFSPTEKGDGAKYILWDGPEAAALGPTPVEFTLPTPLAELGQLQDQVSAWSASLLAAATTLQAVDVRLPPWVDVRLGGVLRVQLDHPNLWDSYTGTSSIDGTARVIGLRRNLQDCSVIAMLLFGLGAARELCPSMPVTAFVGPPGAPTEVTVDAAAAAVVLQAAIAAGAVTSTVVLRHTRPGMGTEWGGGTLTVTVVLAAGVPTGDLTVTAVGLTEDLDALSELTWPDLAGGTDFQDSFAHVQDGSAWK